MTTHNMTVNMTAIRTLAETDRDAAQFLANEFHTVERNKGWSVHRSGWKATVAWRIKQRIAHNGGPVRGLRTTSVY